MLLMVRARPRVSAWLWCGPRRGRAEKPGQASSRGDRSRNELLAGPSARNNGWVGHQHEAGAWAAPMSSPGGTLASGETPSPPKAPRHQPRSEGRPDPQTEQSSAVPSATFRRVSDPCLGVRRCSRGHREALMPDDGTCHRGIRWWADRRGWLTAWVNELRPVPTDPAELKVWVADRE